jgi:tetratricopeptide (TPR) repeat protein
MEVKSINRYISFVLIFIAFIVYLGTICPTVYLGDSGELTTAAFSLGIPHSSGYPLFALIGKLFCMIPIGNIGFRMNLMSVIFSLGAIWIVYSIIYKITLSETSAIFGAFTLAFTSLFWLQTVSAEVYPLHTFFVALLIRLLIYWDEKKDPSRLFLFVFVVGLSFLNHLQTVMLAPAVLFFLIYSDRKSLFNLKILTIISVLFLFALTVYIYLPVRTKADAAIHWGDPDTLRNFYDMVTGKYHRTNYVFGKSVGYFFYRSIDAFILMIKQFGAVILFGVWGFIRLPSIRWKVFYLGIIIFDFFYTVFLNTVYIEVTSFNLPMLIVIAILAGVGVSDLLRRCKNAVINNRNSLYKISNMACCAIPVIFMLSNYGFSNQSSNYTAYEHSLNIFRTVNNKSTIIVGDDNNLFPVTYVRIVERMREDVILYDRYNLFFKYNYMGDSGEPFVYYGKWEDLLSILEKKIIEKNVPNGAYYSLFNTRSISLPDGYSLLPYGILSRAVNGEIDIDQKQRIRIWNYYATESLEDTYYRDYMNREVTANYNFNKGRHLIMLGAIEPGVKRLKLASSMGYSDGSIHMEIALLFSDIGFFNDAEEELQKSMLYTQDKAGVYNNWAYYYSKRGELQRAIDSIKKAISIDPNNTLYYNNLGSLLLKSGYKNEAIKFFKRSLLIDNGQENIKEILNENDVILENGE